MRRFLFDPGEVKGSTVTLCREESHHIATVLRLAVGTGVELFDGCGNLFLGEIEEIGREVRVRLLDRQQHSSPQGSGLWLFQADLKAKKMDFVIQKATELGVERFVPFVSSRSQGRAEEQRRKRKTERWRKLIEGACKQSMRLTLMRCEEELSMAAALDPALSAQTPDLRLLFWEKEQDLHLSDVDWERSGGTVSIMLGPEGGFSEQEVVEAGRAGWQTISLGQHVLRAETATIAATSIVQHYLGNI